jgi:phosphatidylserine decarboxylase
VASRVLNVSSASSVFARCWVHGTNKTSALLRAVRKRAYSTRSGSEGLDGGGGGFRASSSSGLPLYREYTCRAFPDHL